MAQLFSPVRLTTPLSGGATESAIGSKPDRL